MTDKHNIYPLLLSLGLILTSWATGCTPKNYSEPAPDNRPGAGTPRLVIRGNVREANGTPLRGICVAVYGVRSEQETDIRTYNYAITDSAGEYSIIRYRGREIPAEVTLVASDSAEIYREATLFAPIRYDSIETDGYYAPFNGFATADFILERN